MTRFDKRHYPRHRVNLHAVVAHHKLATAVIDLSEGGAGLEWSLPGDITVGSKVRLRFLLTADQSLEIEGRIMRIADGRAGVEFSRDQQDLVRQLMAETKSED